MKVVSVHGVDRDGNAVYESDNLQVLEMLAEDSVKVETIIIDPPYNTAIPYIGYKDSDYPDGWSDFMVKRLVLAKKLMTPTGVMFINIDENELVSILNICYDLFGMSNVNILVWPKVDPRFDANRVEKPIFNVRSAHEYIILCYITDFFKNLCIAVTIKMVFVYCFGKQI